MLLEKNVIIYTFPERKNMFEGYAIHQHVS